MPFPATTFHRAAVPACFRLGNRFELSAGPARNSAMEGVRGLAVLLVFMVHFHAAFSGLLAPGSGHFALSYFLSEIGHCGVDLFFVLSGYLIYGASLKTGLSVGRFWRRRVWRLYPTFLVVFVAYLLLSALFPDRSKIPADLADRIGFLAGNLLMLAGLFPIPPLITVAWSLSFEVFYYVTLPVLVVATGMANWSSRRRVQFFCILAAGFMLLFLVGPLYTRGYWTNARMLMFLVGILIFELRSFDAAWARRISPTLWWLAMLATLGAYFGLHEIAKFQDARFPGRVVTLAMVLSLAVPFYFLLSACLAKGSRAGRPFRVAPLRWLGNMSYSYYLVHSLAVHLAALVVLRALGQGAQPAAPALYWALVVPVFGATLVAAAALFLTVEKPLSLQPGAA